MKQTVQNLLSPSVKKHDSKGSNRQTIAIICSKHGYSKSGYCTHCAHEMKDVTAIHTHDWVKGVWTDIAPEPIYIESKEHLFRECEKRGVMPRAFMKPKSRGVGFEIARR